MWCPAHCASLRPATRRLLLSNRRAAWRTSRRDRLGCQPRIESPVCGLGQSRQLLFGHRRVSNGQFYPIRPRLRFRIARSQWVGPCGSFRQTFISRLLGSALLDYRPVDGIGGDDRQRVRAWSEADCLRVEVLPEGARGQGGAGPVDAQERARRRRGCEPEDF
jgi:hypothetical protein